MPAIHACEKLFTHGIREMPCTILSHQINILETPPVPLLLDPGAGKAYLVGVGELEMGLLSVGQGSADLGELWAWACCDGDNGSGQRTGRDNAPGEHAAGWVSVFPKELMGL